MNIQSYKSKFIQTHRKRIDSILNGSFSPDEATTIFPVEKITDEDISEAGFISKHQLQEAVLPVSEKLTFHSFSKQSFSIKGYHFYVKLDPISFLSSGMMHFTFHSDDDTELPFSSTGFQSRFVPILAFAQEDQKEPLLPVQFVESLFEDVQEFVKPDVQLSLF